MSLYHDHTSPLNSPLASPIGSPYQQGDWDQLQSQFTQQMSLQPPMRQQQPPSSPQQQHIQQQQQQQQQQQSSSTSSSNSDTSEPPQQTKNNNNNTFVHKLHTMVGDIQYQHLIAWTYSGTSFIVCNITEFSRDVLPKHFKHNNFSSFVRQLNMYGFHKVNKSPRGHRTLAENQIWEFSHSKFLRGRADLLDEIKRKALESDIARREHNGVDISSQMTMMQMAQSDMRQQLIQLQSNFSQVVKEMEETKKRQVVQMEMMKNLLQFMSQQLGAPLPPSLTLDTNMNNNNNTNTNDTNTNGNNNINNNNDNNNIHHHHHHHHNNNNNNNQNNNNNNNNNQNNHNQSNNRYNVTSAEQPPPIYITSHDPLPKTDSLYVPSNNQGYNSSSPSSSPQLSPTSLARPSLTVQTHNLQQQIPSSPSSPIGNIDLSQPPLSPASSINSYNGAINTPLPPSPNTFFSDDDPALYSHPHSPHASFLLDQPPIQTDLNLNHHHHHHHQQQQQQQAMINQQYQSVRF